MTPTRSRDDALLRPPRAREGRHDRRRFAVVRAEARLACSAACAPSSAPASTSSSTRRSIASRASIAPRTSGAPRTSWACGSIPGERDHRQHRRLRRGAPAAASRSGDLSRPIRRRSSATRTSPRCTCGSCDAPTCAAFTAPRWMISMPSVRDPTMASLLTALTTPCPTHQASAASCRARACRAAPWAASSAAISRSCSRRSARRIRSTSTARFSSSRRRAIRCPSSTSASCIFARPDLLEQGRRDRLRPALARSLGGGRVRGFPARPHLRSRRSRADGLSGGPRES